jgi:hypothetical protein
MKYSLLIIKFFIIINSTLGLFINVPSNSLVFLNKKANNLVLYNNKPNNINPDKDKNKSKIYKMNYNNDDLENYENDYNNLLIKIYIFLVVYYYFIFKILNINFF